MCRVLIPELSPQVMAPLVPDHDLQSGEQLRAQRALPVLGARHAGLVDARLVVRLQFRLLHPPLAGGTDDGGDLEIPMGFDVSEELAGEGCRLVALWAVLESSTFAGGRYKSGPVSYH